MQKMHISDSCDSIDDRDDSAQAFVTPFTCPKQVTWFSSCVCHEPLTNQTRLEVSLQLLVSNIPGCSSLEFSCSKVNTGMCAG